MNILAAKKLISSMKTKAGLHDYDIKVILKMPPKELGAFVKQLRVSKGLTQQQVGDRLGLNRPHIAKFETGRTLAPGDYVAGLFAIKARPQKK